MQKFCGRTELYQSWLLAALDRLGLTGIDVGGAPADDELAARIRRLVDRPAG